VAHRPALGTPVLFPEQRQTRGRRPLHELRAAGAGRHTGRHRDGEAEGARQAASRLPSRHTLQTISGRASTATISPSFGLFSNSSPAVSSSSAPGAGGAASRTSTTSAATGRRSLDSHSRPRATLTRNGSPSSSINGRWTTLLDPKTYTRIGHFARRLVAPPLKTQSLFERWAAFSDDADYRSVFRDEELLQLSEALFGEIPGTREFVRSVRTWPTGRLRRVEHTRDEWTSGPRGHECLSGRPGSRRRRSSRRGG
jgi:hypothetical protein